MSIRGDRGTQGSHRGEIMKMIDLQGKRIGKLLIVSRLYGHKKVCWVCRCDCGVEFSTTSDNLLQGKTKSCGCIRKRSGKDHPSWSGGKGIFNGYIRVATGRNKRAFEHREIIEAALGREIPKKAVSHHFNGNKTENFNGNLVLCQDRAYHNLLHRRQRAHDACGHADWLKCGYCGEYDSPNNLYVQEKSGNRTDGRHESCHKEYMLKYHRNNGR